MPVPRVALAPLAALLFAGCVGIAPVPPPEEGPARDANPPAAGPPPSPSPEDALPGLLGRGGTGAPAPPNPAPAFPATPQPPPPTPPASTPPASTPPAPPAASTPPPATPPPAGPTPAQPSPSYPGEWSPVRVLAGEDAAPGRYVESFTLGPGPTTFSASLRGVAGARLEMDSLLLVRNEDPSWDQRVRLTASRASPAPGVEEARLVLRDAAGMPLATLDVLAPTPAATVVVPAGATLVASWALTLGERPAPTFSWTLCIDPAP